MRSAHPNSQRREPTLMNRRRFLLGSAACGVGMAAYGASHGRHMLQVEQRTFAIRNLPDAFQGFRIVQIGDIHLEEFTEAWFLERVVAQVNALNPDLVLLTGDFVSTGPMPFPVAWRAAGLCAEVLSQLKPTERYAILGNHDCVVGPNAVIRPLAAAGIPTLVDRSVAIERRGERIWVCGTNDAALGKPDLGRAIPADPGAPVLLMCHEPDYADTVVQHPRFPLIDLMLSGHSHGGQIQLPYFGPLFLPPFARKYYEGLYHFGPMQLYVNRGIGTSGVPLRLYCPAEITQITLMRA